MLVHKNVTTTQIYADHVNDKKRETVDRILVLFYLLNRTKFAFYPSKRLLSDSCFYYLLE